MWIKVRINESKGILKSFFFFFIELLDQCSDIVQEFSEHSLIVFIPFIFSKFVLVDSNKSLPRKIIKSKSKVQKRQGYCLFEIYLSIYKSIIYLVSKAKKPKIKVTSEIFSIYKIKKINIIH